MASIMVIRVILLVGQRAPLFFFVLSIRSVAKNFFDKANENNSKRCRNKGSLPKKYTKWVEIKSGNRYQTYPFLLLLFFFSLSCLELFFLLKNRASFFEIVSNFHNTTTKNLLNIITVSRTWDCLFGPLKSN